MNPYERESHWRRVVMLWMCVWWGRKFNEVFDEMTVMWPMRYIGKWEGR